ncbi:MAG: hypothetical protein L0Y61_03300 [Epsilonproteobacteria bacterium]|nr:hypothetical protein [Campylobacterota bacterium]
MIKYNCKNRDEEFFMQPKRTFIQAGKITAFGLFLSGCTSSTMISSDDFIYRNINFGSNRDASFKQGVHDGCRTEGGNYTKNHEKFKFNKSYRVGWEEGRLKCKD